jgi:predicted HicB family RNase H-like nuclease
MSKRATALDELAAERPEPKPVPAAAADPMVHLTIRVPESLRARARAKAATERRSVQDVITELLTGYVTA